MKLSSPRVLLVILFAALSLLLAACGSDDEGGDGTADLGPDPATLAPADSPIYYEQVVRPEGSQAEDLNSALGKLLLTEDPAAMTISGIDEGLAEDGLSYSEDIEPWLGTRAGAFLTDFDVASEDGEGAVAVAVTDAEAAQSFIDKAAESGDADLQEAEYNGVSYLTEPDEASIGIVGDFLVAGTDEGFKDAVDTSEGDSIADDTDVQEEFSDAPEDSLLKLYVDTPTLVDLIESSGGLTAEQSEQFKTQIAAYADGPVAAWGTATADSMTISTNSPAMEGAGESSDLVTSFPADAWLAFAAGDVGSQIEAQIDQAVSAFESGFESEGTGLKAPDLEAEIRKSTGLDITKDFAWIGDAGGFVQGASVLGIGGGLVIEATDEQAASDSLEKIQTALGKQPGLEITPGEGGGFRAQIAGAPVGAEVAVQDGKVVVAAGGASVDDVLSPAEALGDSDRFGTASESLGDGLTPSFFLDFAPLVSLIESTGQATSDPSYQQAAPYLGALDYLIAGSGADGDRTNSSITLGVKESEGGSSEEAPAAALTP